MSQWCREHIDLLQDLFGPRLFFTPSGSLYRWLLPQITAEAVEQVLSTWVRATSLASATDPLAVDGKTVRGARTAERDAPHLLSCFTHQSTEVWAEVVYLLAILPAFRQMDRNPSWPSAAGIGGSKTAYTTYAM